MLCFVLAFAARAFYVGTLSDPNGIRPITIVVRGTALRIDLSLVMEIGALLSLLAVVVVFRFADGLHSPRSDSPAVLAVLTLARLRVHC